MTKKTAAEGKAMQQGEFQGYMVAKMEDVTEDIRDIKNNDKEQWRAIRKSNIWNKIAGALATAALVVAAWFGFGSGK